MLAGGAGLQCHQANLLVTADVSEKRCAAHPAAQHRVVQTMSRDVYMRDRYCTTSSAPTGSPRPPKRLSSQHNTPLSSSAGAPQERFACSVAPPHQFTDCCDVAVRPLSLQQPQGGTAAVCAARAPGASLARTAALPGCSAVRQSCSRTTSASSSDRWDPCMPAPLSLLALLLAGGVRSSRPVPAAQRSSNSIAAAAATLNTCVAACAHHHCRTAPGHQGGDPARWALAV
jgi:hypothetical protein